MIKNRHHLSLPATRLLFNSYLERYDSVIHQAESAHAQQLEIALHLAGTASFKIVHPLLIESWRNPRVKYRTQPLRLIGLDVETIFDTGQPKLIGCWYPTLSKYHPLLNPNLTSFWRLLHSIMDNGQADGFVTWGRLDIQCIIRLFAPTEKERKRISRGIGANIKKGVIIGSPPVLREVVPGVQFYIAHYIPGRSLKLGYIRHGRETVVWIFNASQFFQNTIATTARGLNLEWKEFARETHLIDWRNFGRSLSFRAQVLASNEQDCRIVTELADILQTRFFEVFDCYPSLLVSTGSLTDAAVSKMLENGEGDYESNSWKWLARNVWNDVDESILAQAESLLAEAFSAGYVDQFAIGYFDTLWTADISAAYPHKIRALPDLRESVVLDGSGNLDDDLQRARSLGYEIETAIIRGTVTIPPTLKFHPITVKTYNRENFRPVGTFRATYLLDERKFCEKYAATFKNETYIIIALKTRKPAPIARVSETLGKMRADLLAQLRLATSPDAKKVLDGQQYLVKVIDNSIYGKTVQTVEVVKDIDGEPVITGYIAGDRFNPLYGAMITARTRIQLAEACMSVKNSGGSPVMCMTDSLYWTGDSSNLPDSFSVKEKTPGKFEPPHSISDAFILKTGQYEYRSGENWHYKMRGLPIDYDELDGNISLYRRLIVEHAGKLTHTIHPKDFRIPIHTRRLISIGSKDLAHLGMISEGTTEISPFVMSDKQSDAYVMHWPECLNGYLILPTPTINPRNPNGTDIAPLQFLSKIYEGHVESWSATRNEEIHLLRASASKRTDELKKMFCWLACQATNMPLPPGRAFRMTWEKLETWYGKSRSEIMPEKYTEESKKGTVRNA